MARPPFRCADRRPSLLLFRPSAGKSNIVHAVEVDHGLASHLVSPDPLVGDQLISLSLSEFAVAATVLELDEPAPLVVIIINHRSCVCFDDLRDNRIMPRRARWAFPRRDPGVDAGLQGGVDFVIADEVPANLVSTPSARSPIARDALIYVTYGAEQKAL